MIILGITSPAMSSAQSYCNQRLAMVTAMSVPTATPGMSESPTSQELANDIVQQVNTARKMYNVQDLVWNVTLSALAESNAMSCGTGVQTYAVNVCRNVDSWQRCIDDWFAESLQFDFDDPVITSDTADFINLVWNSSRQLGCGQYGCPSGWHGVCFFDKGLPSPSISPP